MIMFILAFLALPGAPPTQSWETCITGPGVVASVNCIATFDTDYDNDIDLRDVAYETNLLIHYPVCRGATKEDLVHTIVEIRRIIAWPIEDGLGCGRDYSCTYNQYKRIIQINEAVVRQLIECERPAP